MESTKNKLKSFFTEHWKYMAVSTACGLNIFDALEDPKSSNELSNDLGLNIEKTTLLLEALLHTGFLDKKNNLYSLNQLSEYLTENHPESLKYACMNWSGDHLTAWQNLGFTIATGKSTFEDDLYVFKKPFFEYIDEFPERIKSYQTAMNEYARDDYKNLPEIIDFTKFKSIMDVGGGFGALLKHIKKKFPSVNCTLFEQLSVLRHISQGQKYFDQIPGNFFEVIPKGSEAIILARIIHDWNDDKARIILMNCFDALPEKGTLYIIENCSDKINIDLSLLSLNMSVMCESFERNSYEYIFLANQEGFQFEGDRKLNELQTVLKFTKNELATHKSLK